MRFTTLKSLLLKEKGIETFSLRDNRSYCSLPFQIEETLFGPSLAKKEKESFNHVLEKLRQEKEVDLSISEDYSVRHILFLSYLESFGEENIYPLLEEYKQEADEIIENTKGLKAKRLIDFSRDNFAKTTLLPLAMASDNPTFAKVLFDVPLEVTPIAKIFFNSPLSFWKTSFTSSLLQNEYDFLKSGPLQNSRNLPKEKYDYLVFLIKSAETPTVLKEYYLDLLKKHLVFVDDFYFYPLTKRTGLALLNPFYWMNIQQSVKDQNGMSYPIAKPGFNYATFQRKGLYEEPYRILSKEDGYHFEYELKELKTIEVHSLNSHLQEEAVRFIFSFVD